MRIDSDSRRRLVAATFALVMAVVAMPSSVAAGGSDKLPDLRMASLSDWHIQWIDGRKLLRFDTIIVNVGQGAFELLGNRDCSSHTTCPVMDLRQVIYRTDGTKRYVPRNSHMRWAGDGHYHWHVQKIERYEIFSRLAGSNVRRGAKVSFCFFDNVAYRLSLPGAPNSRVYSESGCGTSGSLSTRVGLSVGWGDLYPWNFVYQWIDITGLAPGPYRVCVTTDLADRFLETSDSNNMVWQNVELRSDGGVSIGTKGWTRCDTGIPTRRSVVPDDDPEQTPVAVDQPGSFTCRIPVEGNDAEDRSTPACSEAGTSAATGATVSAASAGAGSDRARSVAAAKTPTRRAFVVAHATDFSCRI